MNYVPKTTWVSGELLYHTDMNRIEAGIAEAFTATKGDKGDTGEVGSQGIQGVAGEQGIQGPKGDKGDTGLTGSVGATGEQGLQGAKGDQGIQGVEGHIGPKGDQGVQGIQGMQGIKGDTGNGFSIATNYPSVAAMNSDFANALIPINSFVIIASADADNGRLFVKTATSFVFHAQLAGVKGDKGDTGAQGIQGERGLQGERGATGLTGATGPQGDRGIQGPIGNTGATGAAGAKGDQGERGLQGATGATGSTGLTGAKGDKGDKGDTGAQGPASTYTLPAATAGALGGIRVGTGLAIASGILSVEQKEYLAAYRTNGQTLTAAGDMVNFNHAVISRGITYNQTTSQFSLKANRAYRVTFTTSISFTTNTGFVSFALYNTAGTRLNDATGLFSNIASAYNEGGNSALELIYVPTANTDVNIRVSSISASTTATLRAGYTSLIVQEL